VHPHIGGGNSFLCGLDQRAKRVDRDTERSSRKAVDVSGVDADDLSLGIENGTTAAAVGSGRVVNQLVSYDIS